MVQFLKSFCFCCDLRRGCIVYAWLQMMIVTLLASKFSWINNIFAHSFEIHHSGVMYFILQMSIMIALQIIKGVSSAALIWGLVKKNHMFYQPWLFINGLENSILSFVTGALFVIGCMDTFFFSFLPFTAVLAVFGWYIWACVMVVYKRDMKPHIIAFDSNYENFNMNNVNINV